MSSGIVLVLPIIGILVVLGIVLIALPRRRKLVSINEFTFPELARLRSVTATSRISALAAGVIIAVALAILLPLGLGVFLAPTAFAGVQIMAVLVAGAVSRNAARTPGVSGLEVRRIRRYLPMGLTALVGSVTVILLGALAWTTAAGSPDSLGNAGRNFSYLTPCDVEMCETSVGPFPGSFYSIPLVTLLAVVFALAGIAVIMTVRRPRNASDPEIVRIDDVVRARAVESVVAALGLAVATTLFAVGFLVANGLGNPSNDLPALLRIPGWGAVPLMLASLSVALWCLVVLLLPGGAAHAVRDATVSDTPRPVTP